MGFAGGSCVFALEGASLDAFVVETFGDIRVYRAPERSTEGRRVGSSAIVAALAVNTLLDSRCWSRSIDRGNLRSSYIRH